jgi:hypothetical protein
MEVDFFVMFFSVLVSERVEGNSLDVAAKGHGENSKARL